MGGSDVTNSEHLNALLVAYQYAEKIYSQCVTDVVNAEIRRDQAEHAKQEAFGRLEEARERFASGGSSSNLNYSNSNSNNTVATTKTNSNAMNNTNSSTNNANVNNGNSTRNNFGNTNARNKLFANGTSRDAGQKAANGVSAHSTVPSLMSERFRSPTKRVSHDGPPKELGPGTSVHSTLTTATFATSDTERRSSKSRSGSPKGTRASLKQSLKKAAQKQPGSQQKPNSVRSIDLKPTSTSSLMGKPSSPIKESTKNKAGGGGGGSVATSATTTTNTNNNSSTNKNIKSNSNGSGSSNKDKNKDTKEEEKENAGSVSNSPKTRQDGAGDKESTTASSFSPSKKLSPIPSSTTRSSGSSGVTPSSAYSKRSSVAFPLSRPSPNNNNNNNNPSEEADPDKPQKPMNMFKLMDQKRMVSPKPVDPHLPPAFRKRNSLESSFSSISSNHQQEPALPKQPPLSTTSSPTTSPKEKVTNDIPSLFSPTPSAPGSKKSLKKLLASKKVEYSKLDASTKLLEIATGRTAEWMQQNLNCDRLGLVKNFFHASFGTRTSDKTQKVRVFTLVINDESNDIVSTCGEVMDFYISSGNNPSKPSLRDRAAEALVTPPQKEPVAMFAAPKSSLQTSDIYYIGHWKVIDGERLNPPKMVKGQPKQTLVKFQFVGVNPALIQAMNNNDDEAAVEEAPKE